MVLKLHVVPAEGMGCQWQFCQRMIVAFQSDGGGVTDVADDLYAVACFADAESASSQYLLVALGVQFGEPLAEFKLIAVNHDCAVGLFLALHGIGGQTSGIDAQEVAHAGLFQFEKTCHSVVRHNMHDVLLHGAENPLEHIVEMYSDVGGHTAALVHIALPRRIVPFATRGDIGEVDIVHFVLGTFVNLLFQSNDAVVEAELKNGVGLVACFFLQFNQVVDIVGVQYQRFFANHVASQSQTVADESVVGVIGGADGKPLQRIVGALLLGAETVELLLLGEERTVGERTVQTTHAVETVVCCDEVVAGVGNGFEVSGGDISGCAD